MTYHPATNPLKDALAALTGSEPPHFLNGCYHSSHLKPSQRLHLTSWCALNACIPWAAGESILDAADLLVDRAIEKAQIAPLYED